MLSAFATFLKREHLPELGRMLIGLAREQDLPMLKFVQGPEEALVAGAGAWLEITLTRLERGEPLPTFFDPQPHWKRVSGSEFTIEKLQPADLLADRRLTDPELTRRLRETPQLGHLQEHPKLLHFHNHSLWNP